MVPGPTTATGTAAASATAASAQQEVGWRELAVAESEPAPLSPSWGRVRRGLGFVYAGIAVAALAVSMLAFAGAIIVLSPFTNAPAAAAVASFLAMPALLVLPLGLLGQLIGMGLCCAVPDDNGRRWARNAFICAAIAGIMALVTGGLVPFAESVGVFLALPILLAGLTGLLSHFLFVLFLKTVAGILRSERVSDGLSSYVVSYGIMAVVGTLLALGGPPLFVVFFGKDAADVDDAQPHFQFRNVEFEAAGALLILLVLAGLLGVGGAMILWFLSLIRDLRELLRRALKRSASSAG
jgi:hypothetical protein